VAESPLGTQASFHAAQRLFDSQTTLSTRLSSVFKVVLVPGCAAFGPMTLVAMEKLLVLAETVPGGTPVKEITVSVLVVLLGLLTQDPVQSVTR
jgi:hypothetical protein